MFGKAQVKPASLMFGKAQVKPASLMFGKAQVKPASLMKEIDRRLREAGQAPAPPPDPAFAALLEDRLRAGALAPEPALRPAPRPAGRRGTGSPDGRRGRARPGPRVGGRPARRRRPGGAGGVGHRHGRRPARRDRRSGHPRPRHPRRVAPPDRKRRPRRRGRDGARSQAGSEDQQGRRAAVPHHRSPHSRRSRRPPRDGSDGDHLPSGGRRDAPLDVPDDRADSDHRAPGGGEPVDDEADDPPDGHQAPTTSTSGPATTVAALRIDARYKGKTVKLQWSAYNGQDFAAYLVLRTDGPAEPGYPVERSHHGGRPGDRPLRHDVHGDDRRPGRAGLPGGGRRQRAPAHRHDPGGEAATAGLSVTGRLFCRPSAAPGSRGFNANLLRSATSAGLGRLSRWRWSGPARRRAGSPGPRR